MKQWSIAHFIPGWSIRLFYLGEGVIHKALLPREERSAARMVIHTSRHMSDQTKQNLERVMTMYVLMRVLMRMLMRTITMRTKIFREDERRKPAPWPRRRLSCTSGETPWSSSVVLSLSPPSSSFLLIIIIIVLLGCNSCSSGVNFILHKSSLKKCSLQLSLNKSLLKFYSNLCSNLCSYLCSNLCSNFCSNLCSGPPQTKQTSWPRSPLLNTWVSQKPPWPSFKGDNDDHHR